MTATYLDAQTHDDAHPNLRRRGPRHSSSSRTPGPRNAHQPEQQRLKAHLTHVKRPRLDAGSYLGGKNASTGLGPGRRPSESVGCCATHLTGGTPGPDAPERRPPAPPAPEAVTGRSPGSVLWGRAHALVRSGVRAQFEGHVDVVGEVDDVSRRRGGPRNPTRRRPARRPPPFGHGRRRPRRGRRSCPQDPVARPTPSPTPPRTSSPSSGQAPTATSPSPSVPRA